MIDAAYFAIDLARAVAWPLALVAIAYRVTGGRNNG